MEDLDIIKEFLIESNENLGRLDQEIVELEKDPANHELVASIFRTIHTIKGTCGFLGFDKLTGITHSGENILSQVREGKRKATGHLISIILQAVDATKEILEVIERTGGEGDNAFLELKERLEAFAAADEQTEAAYVGKKSLAPVPTPTPIMQEVERDGKAVLEQEKAAEEVAAEELSSEGQAQKTATATGASQGAESEVAAAAWTDGGERGAPARNNAVVDSTIRVDVSLLDKLMNLVGELVLARNQVLQFTARLETGTFNATSQRLNLITSELQESVMKTRMQPIGVVWSKFPRVVRDLAAECGKYIQLTMDGAETELDRTIIEAIKDPLTHIVRNSCDHGIEQPEERTKKGKAATGRLTLRAFHEGGRVNIEISDDGGGISPARVKAKAIEKGLISSEQAARLTEREAGNLIFLPGFSTAEKISSISGRGVGMDVVKTNIERIGGVVDLLSTEGQGTTIKIRIPLTLAIIPGLVVSCSGERFIIPQVSLIELIRLEGESGLNQIERIHGTPVYRRRGKLLPLTFLEEILRMPASKTDADVVNIVVLQAEDSEFGLVVDTINDTQEIVVKPLDKRLKGLSMYSGATIMGDGKVALILDVLGVAQRSGVLGQSREVRTSNKGKTQDGQGKERQTLLLFSAGRFARLAVPLSLVARLEEIPSAQIELAAGKMAVQYRGQILPLVSLAAQLDPGAFTTPPARQKVEVIVLGNGAQLIGLVVDRILDIVEEHVTIRKSSKSFGLMGSAVVGRKVTDFLDIHEIIANSGEKWTVGQRGSTGTTVLVLEPSSFARAHLRSSLEMAGYRVVEAAGFQEAVDGLLHEKVGIVAASVAFAELAKYVKGEPKLAHIPVLGLLAEAGQSAAHLNAGLFEDFQMMFDRTAMLGSLERLAAVVEQSEHELASARR
jgi:two-component system, chemotaxis family, sensor kinase CheA